MSIHILRRIKPKKTAKTPVVKEKKAPAKKAPAKKS